ncbi:MAG: hypothetical protein IKS64_03850 [Muribaculaceae bacterium]|jgi:hypothetical protein|nr:hypothetical protein [Prevotella sp.]MBR6431965.1 hypothetical protein [Muribaculaceae bacterium]
MTTKNNRLKYEKPAMQVFELRQQPQLLAGSTGSGGLQDYDWNNVPEE